MEKSLLAFTRSKTTKIFFRKEHSLAAQAMVIFLRFGSLSSDEKPWLTSREVQKRTGILIASQYNIVKRWRQRGFVVVKAKR
jgi:hypothetical protein